MIFVCQHTCFLLKSTYLRGSPLAPLLQVKPENRAYIYIYVLLFLNFYQICLDFTKAQNLIETVGPTYVEGLLTMQQLAALATWSESSELKFNNRCGNILPSKKSKKVKMVGLKLLKSGLSFVG